MSEPKPGKLRIYFSGAWEPREHIRIVSEAVCAKLDATNTSGWLYSNDEEISTSTKDMRKSWADRDLADIRGSDVMVCVLERKPGRGGRHFEAGYALALHKHVLALGEDDNIFYELVPSFSTMDALCAHITSNKAIEALETENAKLKEKVKILTSRVEHLEHDFGFMKGMCMRHMKTIAELEQDRGFFNNDDACYG